MARPLFETAIPAEFSRDLEQLVKRLSVRVSYWNQHQDVQEALNRWADLVVEEENFGDFIEDYLAHLGARDLLSDVLEHAEGGLKVWLLRVIDEIEKSFIGQLNSTAMT
jgi:hypothetical protein